MHTQFESQGAHGDPNIAVLSDIRDRVEKTYAAQYDEIGYVQPDLFARQLLPDVEPDDPSRETIARAVLCHPTKDHLYEGSQDMLQGFLGQGDNVRLWTDDYTLRVNTSGLIGSLRRSLPHAERERFQVAHYPDRRVIMDKFPLLPILFDEAREQGISTVAIIDNSQKNINKAARIAYAVGNGLSVNLMTVDHDAPEGYVSPAFKLENVTHRAIGHVASLGGMRDELLASSAAGERSNVLWIVDFNETLMDTRSLEQSLYQKIAEIIFQNNNILLAPGD